MEVVLLANLDSFIARTMKRVHDSVVLSRSEGIQAELPAKVDFDVVVIDDWQALEMKGGDESTSTQTDGGTSTQTTNTDSTDNSTGTETRTTNSANGHTQTSQDNLSNYE